jgi:group I intron endonuclease
MSGIYIIQNLRNHKVYIGSAVNFKARWADHSKKLENKLHCNAPLQLAWSKHGKENFYFWVAERVGKNFLIEKEQFYLDMFQVYPFGFYNVCLIAGSRLGVKHSEKTRKKMSEAKKGNQNSKGSKRSKEFKVHVSEVMKGKRNYICTEKTRRKMSQTHKGKILSVEHKKKISDSLKRMSKLKTEKNQATFERGI